MSDFVPNCLRVDGFLYFHPGLDMVVGYLCLRLGYFIKDMFKTLTRDYGESSHIPSCGFGPIQGRKPIICRRTKPPQSRGPSEDLQRFHHVVRSVERIDRSWRTSEN